MAGLASCKYMTGSSPGLATLVSTVSQVLSVLLVFIAVQL